MLAQPYSGHTRILCFLTQARVWLQRLVDEEKECIFHCGGSSAKQLKVAPSAGGYPGTVRNKAEPALSTSSGQGLVFSHYPDEPDTNPALASFS